MFLDELIRNKLYFLIDKMKLGIVSKNIQRLENFYKLSKQERVYSIEEDWETFRKEVMMNTPFYSNYSDGSSLNDFPIINKKLIAKDANAFYSRKYSQNMLVPIHTSGSYGTPLTYFLTKDKKKKQLAEVIYYGRKSGYDVGVRHGYFRSNPPKTKIKFWIQNETFFASRNLNNEFLESGLENLKKKRLKSLMGFPSAISYLAKYCTDQGYSYSDFSVKGVITSSENLTKNHREIICRAFNCLIHNRYSTEELGVLGNEYNLSSGFDMNTCNYIIEVLALDKDESVSVGEIGRVVITDLHSNAMPLIRYETGDLARIGSFLDEEKKWVDNLKTLSGRTIQIIYDTKGNVLYPLYFDTIMDNYDCFAQYQLIQLTGNDYCVKLVKNSNFKELEFNMKAFIQRLYDWLGSDAKLDVEFVEDIERLPSGKRPYIINKYKAFSI